MNFDRKQFKLLLDDILSYKVAKLYITYKDRLSRISFDMFQRLFAEFGCEIVVINDSDDKSDEAEIFEEIISFAALLRHEDVQQEKKTQVRNSTRRLKK